MDRNLHPPMVPFCPTRIAHVDQYSWPEIDQTERLCMNGVTKPIYNCAGNVSYTLPLSDYPKANAIHPEIAYSRFPHFGYRDPQTARYVTQMQRDRQQGRIEGFYM